MEAPVASLIEIHASGASRRVLEGQRWHLQHGPIDLLVAADGPTQEVARVLEAVWQQFAGVLPELVAELPALRQAFNASACFQSVVAQRMARACRPFLPEFVTPMAAVAGAVADELIVHFRGCSAIQRAYINNGGDIALHLQPGQQFRVGLFADIAQYAGPDTPLDGDFAIDASLPVRGVASSGWRGRSFSLGAADVVTVLAASAATADVAATLIGNRVMVDHPAIWRMPASSLKDDTDLGERLVVAQVDALPRPAIDEALEAGRCYADQLVKTGQIYGAVLVLQGQVRVAGLHNIKKDGHVRVD